MHLMKRMPDACASFRHLRFFILLALTCSGQQLSIAPILCFFKRLLHFFHIGQCIAGQEFRMENPDVIFQDKV